MISVKDISKTYKLKRDKVVALDKVSLEVQKGEIFGLIGPDGAGKTSLLRILTTLILPDEGTAIVDGLNVDSEIKQIRLKVGYMPGRFSLYQDLSIIENINFFADIFGTTLEENYEIIKDIYSQIEPFKDRRAGKLSGGMKQKLALCCALIHKPEILFLDEPTTGVDPVSRKEFWGILKKLNSSGMTIMVSTPYMDEASLCDRIALMQNGKILSINSPEEIEHQYSNRVFAAKSKDNYQLLKLLREQEYISSAYIFGEFLHITFKNNEPKEIEGVEIKEIKPTVEDCFIELMGSKNESN